MVKNQEIECLRGAAILAVLAAHIYTLTGLGTHLPSWLSGGGGGVQLFFVISGFVVGKSLLARLDAGPGAPAPARVLAAFYIRRFFRLAPLAVVAIATTFALRSGYILRGVTTLDPFFADLWQIVTFRLNYAFVDEIHGHPLGVFWSLVVEEHFYLALPLILVAVRGRKLRFALGTVVVLMTILVIRPGQEVPDETVDYAQRRILYATHALLDFFASGVLIALLESARGALDLRRWRVMVGLLAPALLLFIAGLGQSLVATSIEPASTARVMTALWLASTAVVFVAAQKGVRVLPGPLRPVFVYLGSRSYGIYLLHYPIIIWFQYQFVEAGLDPRLGFMDFAALALALVAMGGLVEGLHRWLELPLIARGSLYAGRILGEAKAVVPPSLGRGAGEEAPPERTDAGSPGQDVRGVGSGR